METNYPWRLVPQVKETVWGGRWLADTLGRPGPASARLGESWEAFSGSLIGNGRLAGQTVGELFHAEKTQLFGKAAARYSRFPLLAKFIDARENLSIQVHPDDALAQAMENYPYGKTEFWYILSAEPGAAIYHSLTPKACDLDTLRAALERGEVLPYVRRVPVQAGDVAFIPAGTVHALGAGVVVYELQQECDITYRLYDWGRTDREIHIDKGLQSISFTIRPEALSHPVLAPSQETTLLSRCDYFTSHLLQISHSITLPGEAESFRLLTVLEGSGGLLSPSEAFSPEPLRRGETWLLPACLDVALEPEAQEHPLSLIASKL